MRRFLWAAYLCIVGSATQAAGIVALDGYHNNEKASAGHYRWEGTNPGGYSQLAALIEQLGAQTRTIVEPLNAHNLKDVDVLIIAHPDDSAGTAQSMYISDGEIAALEEWVREGGRLLLFGNSRGD